MSVFLSYVCLSKILGNFMKWGLRNQRAEKGLNNGDFQVVLFLSFMQTTLYISFFYSNNMEKFYKIQEKIEFTIWI